MIQDGRPNKEIAARLEVTPRAVELRRASLMRKLGVRSLPDLLRLTIGHETRRRPSGVALTPTSRPRHRNRPTACHETRHSCPRFDHRGCALRAVRPFGFAKVRRGRRFALPQRNGRSRGLARSLPLAALARAADGHLPPGCDVGLQVRRPYDAESVRVPMSFNEEVGSVAVALPGSMSWDTGRARPARSTRS